MDTKSDPPTNGNSKVIKLAIPSWLASVATQSPTVALLLLILWLFRSDGIDALHQFTQINIQQRQEFIRSLEKLEQTGNDRADALLQARAKEVDRMILTLDKLSDTIKKSSSLKPDGL
jgi:hypothetical protein